MRKHSEVTNAEVVTEGSAGSGSDPWKETPSEGRQKVAALFKDAVPRWKGDSWTQ